MKPKESASLAQECPPGTEELVIVLKPTLLPAFFYWYGYFSSQH